MVGASAARRLTLALVSCGMLLGATRSAHAFEYFDGRIQVHGYFEETVRAISTNFNESLDLTQWYNILRIEMDIDIAKDGWGPFDSVGAYIGAEVRYDCIWTRACGISPGGSSRALIEAGWRCSQAVGIRITAGRMSISQCRPLLSVAIPVNVNTTSVTSMVSYSSTFSSLKL